MPQARPDAVALIILVVEDNDLLREMFKKSFHSRHEVFTAARAIEGWNLCLQKNPHIVFLDIGLPDASGHDLARRIKEWSPTTHVIMATANDYEDDIEAARRNRVDGFIVKPFSKEEITICLDRYIALHQGTA